ncbi:hypothetical protein ACFL5P_03495, partial [candidate division KSB1 bacterium]
MKWINKILMLLCIALIVNFIGCENQPVKFAEDELTFIQIEQNIKTVYTYLDSSEVILGNNNKGLAFNVVIGSYDQVEYDVLLKFTNLPENVQILSAQVSLTPEFVHGTSGNDFAAEIHEITSSWNETKESTIDYDQTVLSSGSIAYSGSAADIFDLPVPVVQKWVDAVSDSLIGNYGVIIKPLSADFAKQYNLTGIKLNIEYNDGVSTNTAERSPSNES